MKKYWILLFCLPFLFAFETAQNDTKMNRIKVAKNVSMMMPTDFRAMTDAEIASRFFTYRKPVAVYTDPQLVCTLGYNIAPTEWAYKDLEILKGIYKATIVGVYGITKMLQETIKTIDGQKYIVFEFVGDAKDDTTLYKKRSEPTYNYLQYTVVDSKIYVFNFSCASRYQRIWQEKVGQMMGSVKLTKQEAVER